MTIRKAGCSLNSQELFKYTLVVLKFLPVLAIVLLSAPAWLCWPFLSADRQQVVLEMVHALADWTRRTR